MVTGIPKSDIVRYDGLADLEAKLTPRLAELTDLLVDRRAALARYAEVNLGRRIHDRRLSLGMSPEEVARSTRVKNAFTAEQLTRWETSSDLECGLDIVLVREIAHALTMDPRELFQA
jgi:hypothetical protein